MFTHDRSDFARGMALAEAAANLPGFEVLSNPQPTLNKPISAKGAGEAGTVGALAAAISAIRDALGVEHIDMPATPEQVWAALRHSRPA